MTEWWNDPDEDFPSRVARIQRGLRRHAERRWRAVRRQWPWRERLRDRLWRLRHRARAWRAWIRQRRAS